MDWRIKGGIQSVLSHVPGGRSVNDLLQRVAGGRRDLGAEVGMKFSEDWLVQMKALREARLSIADRDLVEIGTGWLPVFPLCFHLAGARRCRSYDLTRHLRPHAVRSTLQALEKHLSALADAAEQPLDVVRDRWHGLMQVEQDDDLLEKARVIYEAPADAARTTLDDRSVTLVFSNSVLEHVTPAALSSLMQETQRILEPGGLALHSVNCGDHYAYFDASITPIHYLRYSDRHWRWWSNDLLYQNRLRPIDFIESALSAGLEIRLDWQRPREDLLAIFDSIPIAERFRRYPREQLCCTSITFAAAPRERCPG